MGPGLSYNNSWCLNHPWHMSLLHTAAISCQCIILPARWKTINATHLFMTLEACRLRAVANLDWRHLWRHLKLAERAYYQLIIINHSKQFQNSIQYENSQLHTNDRTWNTWTQHDDARWHTLLSSSQCVKPPSALQRDAAKGDGLAPCNAAHECPSTR